MNGHAKNSNSLLIECTKAMKDEDTSDWIAGVMSHESPEFYTEDRIWLILPTLNQEALFV